MKSKFLAFVFPIIGGCLALTLPYPFHWFAFWTGASLGVVCLLKKYRRVILRIGSLTWTREEVCRHILITGDTGSGKTTSGFHPILVQLTRNEPNWGLSQNAVFSEWHFEYVQMAILRNSIQPDLKLWNEIPFNS